MIDCIVCQYWSERLYHAKLHSSSGTVSGSEVRRVIGPQMGSSTTKCKTNWDHLQVVSTAAE
jgi:hypothetical protein